MSYPYLPIDVILGLLILGVVAIVLSLRARVRRVELTLEPLASVPGQLREMKTLLDSALPAMQQRNDELEAHVIASHEELRADVLKAIREIPTCKAK